MSIHNIPFPNRTKKIILNYPKSAAMGFCSKGPKNEFETAMVNEPSVFEPLKFYCSKAGATLAAGAEWNCLFFLYLVVFVSILDLSFSLLLFFLPLFNG